jgi:flagellar basal body-associated protein FliL
MVIAGAALLGSAASWFLLVEPAYFEDRAPVVYTPEEIAHAPRPVLVLDERVMNIAGSGQGRYLKVGMAVEFDDPVHLLVGKTPDEMDIENEELQLEMERYLPRILDTMHQLLSSSEFTGITAATADPFKEAFLAEINQIVDGRSAIGVYLTTFLTQ